MSNWRYLAAAGGRGTAVLDERALQDVDRVLQRALHQSGLLLLFRARRPALREGVSIDTHGFASIAALTRLEALRGYAARSLER